MFIVTIGDLIWRKASYNLIIHAYYLLNWGNVVWQYYNENKDRETCKSCSCPKLHVSVLVMNMRVYKRAISSHFSTTKLCVFD